MQRSRRRIKRSRINQRKRALPRSDHRQLGEPYIITNRHSHFPVFWEVDDGDFVSRGEDLAFFEGDAPRDVDVEEVDFAVGGEEGAVAREGQAGVVELAGGFFALGDGAAD